MVDVCLTERYTVDGISEWTVWPMRMAQWFLIQHVCFRLVLLIPLLCIVVILLAVEFVIWYPAAAIVTAMAYWIILPSLTTFRNKEL